MGLNYRTLKPPTGLQSGLTTGLLNWINLFSMAETKPHSTGHGQERKHKLCLNAAIMDHRSRGKLCHRAEWSRQKYALMRH